MSFVQKMNGFFVDGYFELLDGDLDRNLIFEIEIFGSTLKLADLINFDYLDNKKFLFVYF
mgnify:CR=1 FL=1